MTYGDPPLEKTPRIARSADWWRTALIATADRSDGRHDKENLMKQASLDH
jgi:hypothetical protein